MGRLLVELIRARRQRSIRPARRLPPVQQFPDPAERMYARDLLAFVDAIEQETRTQLQPSVLPFLAREARRDAAVDLTVSTRIEGVRVEIARRWSAKELADIARRTGRSVDEFVARQLRRQLSAVLGVEVLVPDRFSSAILDRFAQRNAELIQSIPSDYLRRVQRLATEALRDGERSESFIEQLLRLGDITRSRARLIARDQVSKLNGQATKVRQEAVGIQSYTWRTSRDDRVRDTHAALEGQVFYWSAPPDVGHPGEDYQCRCRPEPNVEEVLSMLEAEEGEPAISRGALIMREEDPRGPRLDHAPKPRHT